MIVLKDENIFDIGIPNKNNRIYSKDCVTEVLQHYKVFGYLNMNMEVCDADRSHVVYNLRYENDSIIDDVEILDTPNGKILQDIIGMNGEDFAFRPAGTGNIEVLEDGTTIVKDYKLISINYTNDPA